MARLTQGSARMLNNDALEDDEVDDGWVLTCQALPTSRDGAGGLRVNAQEDDPDGVQSMSRVAVVTGGASGMGEATCHELGRRGLQSRGPRPQRASSATCHRRSSRRRCHRRRGGRRRHRPARRRAGVRQGSQRTRPGHGPGDQRRAVRLLALHRDHRRILGADHRRQPDRHLSLLPSRAARHAGREMGQDRDDLVVERPARITVRRPLRRVQGRGDHLDQVAGPRIRRRTGSRSTTSRRRASRPRCSTRGKPPDTWVPTNRLASNIPVGHLGTGADIAAAVGFLCSDEAGFITGQVLGVNGGAVM